MTSPAQATELLFSYGTLQLESVQISTFGRALTGTPDALPEYKQGLLAIADPSVAAALGKTHYSIAQYTGNPSDAVPGMVLAITPDELQRADDYEIAEYRRVAVVLRSGRRAWAYVDAVNGPPKT
jgi:hypothetical protein